MKTPVRSITRFLALASAFAVASCATPAAQAPVTEKVAEAATAVVGPPDVAWKDMTKEQRGAYMKAVVMPKMQATFGAHDATEFAKISCKTCHGSGVADHSFKMPSADLPKLPGKPEGWAALQKEHPNDMKFMAEQVKPQMAALLGMPEFNPEKPEAGGFGCMGCHMMEAP